MSVAKDIAEAAYNQLQTFDRNVWETDDVAPFDEIYVRRPQTTAGASPSDEIKVALLHARDPIKVFLTGQRGSGKSMELRRVHEDPEVAKAFEHVKFVAIEWLNLYQSTMADLLVALAATLAMHIVDKKYDKAKDWKEKAGAVTKWIAILPEIVRPGAPGAADLSLTDFSVAFKIPFVELSSRLREDVDLRERVLKQESYSVSTLARLVADLLGIVRHYAKKDVLVTLDDGDKLTLPEIARDIFLRHVEALVRLPCRAVVTFPYWLHFEKEWNPVALQNQVVVLQNVKVIERGKPGEVLPAAFGFFRLMYAKLVDLDAGFVSDDVLREAVRLSAGIPREFLRVLQKGFAFAALRNLPKVTRDLLNLAVIELRRQMIYATQTEDTRKRLMGVQRTERLVDGEDWSLLSSLLVVELTNEKPWYAVHPLLDGEVAEWIREEDRRQAAAEAKAKAQPGG
jgi:hypothetical protein